MSMDNTGSQILGRREFLAAATAATMVGGSVHAQADLPPGRFEMTVINPEGVSGGCGLCVIMRTPAGRTIGVSSDGRMLNVTTDPAKLYPEKEK